MAQSSTTTALYKSRTNLLSLLKNQGFETKDYEEFSVNEVHIMNNNKQLDMLLSSPEGSDSPKNVLNKTDTLIIIMRQEPHEPLTAILNEIWEQEGIFIILFNLERLQFNILQHSYVPKHEIIEEQEIKFLKQRYNIRSNDDLPDISRYDPVAQAIGLRPGQICKITRNSKTAISAEYYRICSQ